MRSVRDTVRLLHRDSTYCHPALGTGYTDRPSHALFAEPEAISVEAQRELTAAAERNAHQLQVQEWQLHRAEIDRRIGWLYSQRLRADVSAQLHQLRRQLERIDRKIGAPS